MVLAINAASLQGLKRGFDNAGERFARADDCLACKVFSEKVIMGTGPQAIAYCL